MNLVVSVSWVVRLVALGFVLGVVLGLWVATEGLARARETEPCGGTVAAGRCVPAPPATTTPAAGHEAAP